MDNQKSKRKSKSKNQKEALPTPSVPQETKEPSPPKITDETAASADVEKELQEHFLGVVKIYSEHITTEWKQTGIIPNRRVDSAAVKKLCTKFATNLDRSDSRHHMKVTIDKNDVTKLMKALNMTKTQLRNTLITCDYPLINPALWNQYKGTRLVLQAGQHRFAALKELMPDQGEQWWPAQIYAEPLSLDALDRLRSNTNEVHTALNDGERFLHLSLYQKQLDEIEASNRRYTEEGIAEKSKLNRTIKLKFDEFDPGSIARAQQLWNRPGLRNAVADALEIPGLAATLSLAAFGDILSLRIMNVKIKYHIKLIYRLSSDSWDRLPPSGRRFSSSIVISSQRHMSPNSADSIPAFQLTIKSLLVHWASPLPAKIT